MDWYRSKVFTWRKSAASVVEAMTLREAKGIRLKARGSQLSSECGPCLFLKEHLPKRIPLKHNLA